MKKGLLLAYLLSLLFASCKEDFDYGKARNNYSSLEEYFAADFEETFCAIPKNHSWITTESKTISLDVNGLKDKEYTLYIYSEDPTSNTDSRIIAESPYSTTSGPASFEYDAPSGASTMFVSIVGADGSSFTESFDSNSKNTVTFSSNSNTQPLLSDKPMGYILAFEFSLGGESLDYDYNDIVARINFVQGRKDAEVEILALGCQDSLKFVFNNTTGKEAGDELIFGNEMHAALGFPGEYNYYYKKMYYYAYNTGLNTCSYIPSAKVSFPNRTIKHVEEVARMFFTTVYFGDGGNVRAMLPETGATVPEAICVADPHWRWPDENKPIDDYYYDFVSWVKNEDSAKGWYKNCAK